MSTMSATRSTPYERLLGGQGRDFLGWRDTQTNAAIIPFRRKVSGLEYLTAPADVVILNESAGETTFPQSPVDAVKFLSDVLGRPKEQVLAAVGISHRTFFGWSSKSDRLPRKNSLGRLWPMVHAISGMREANSGFTAWFQSSGRAQELFDTGNYSALVALDFETRFSDSVYRPLYNPGNDFTTDDLSTSEKAKIDKRLEFSQKIQNAMLTSKAESPEK